MRLFTFVLVLLLQTAPPPDPKVREEYQALVKQLDLENHPERHQQAAACCLQKKWKSQADLHDLEFRWYQFRKEKKPVAYRSEAFPPRRSCPAAAGAAG